MKELNALAGKTFPLLVSPTGERLAFKRGKYENPPDGVPSFAFRVAEPMTIGKAVTLSGDDLRPEGVGTLLEVRDLGRQRAAVISMTSRTNEVNGSGTIVVSVLDGLLLLVDLHGELKAEGVRPAERVHLALRRQNVPGLDRLAAELQMED